MKSIKAILAGTVFIVIVILFLQLLYIFVAVAYNAMADDFPVLNDIAPSFRYLIGIPVFISVMFIGGYITASIAGEETTLNVVLHCLVVGLITAIGMIYPTLGNADITVTGMVIVVLALGATVGGGLYRQKSIKAEVKKL
ncbi:MAG: hypothetical protein IMF14_06250 [Proteobacteria bacterium]|nr:hypothetical protein [Pseudomonadota bacterium]